MNDATFRMRLISLVEFLAFAAAGVLLIHWHEKEMGTGALFAAAALAGISPRQLMPGSSVAAAEAQKMATVLLIAGGGFGLMHVAGCSSDDRAVVAEVAGPPVKVVVKASLCGIAALPGCESFVQANRVCAPATVVAGLDASENVLLDALDQGVKPEDAAARIALRTGWTHVFCVATHLLADPPAEVAGPAQARRCLHRPVRRDQRKLLEQVRDRAARELR